MYSFILRVESEQNYLIQEVSPFTFEWNSCAFCASINKYMTVGNKRIIINKHTEINFEYIISITYVKDTPNLHTQTHLGSFGVVSVA